MAEWSHLDESGQARMVNVAEKSVTHRVAEASGLVCMQSATLDAIRGDTNRKGDVLAAARIAGIQAAKRTDMLIPLCHSIGLDGVEVHFREESRTKLRIHATVRATARTGVEMEALVAVSTAALTIYDMCKALDREMTIEAIRLESKSGGRSGEFRRQS
ncbi:cyclic pyranopterin monophosphate synthase MoaC [bacterium]|nr:cyclic pyranopterin monophosphate synthase MoaC [bacterium]